MSTPTPIPETKSLVIPWPHTRPLDVPVSAEALKEAWDTLVVPLADGPQSIEVRVLMATVRAVYDGMHGITGEVTS